LPIRPGRFIGRDVLLLMPEHVDRAERVLSPGFDAIDSLSPAPIRDDGRALAEVAVLRRRNLRHWPPP